MLLPTVTAAAGASVPYYQGDVRRYRQKCPYLVPKDPTVPDVRFWDHTQAEFYRNILKKKPENRVVPQKWINWEWMASKDDPVFQQIRAKCDKRQLTELMGLC